MLASWGASEYTIAASGDKYIVTAGIKTYTLAFSSAGLGFPLPTIVAEFEVMDASGASRPFLRTGQTLSLLNFVEVGFNGARSWGDESFKWNCLDVFAPSTEEPTVEYSISIWVDWLSTHRSAPIPANSKTLCTTSESEQYDIPAAAIWSFGNLLTYQGVPTIG